MPSIAQDISGNAAVGYSVSSASTHPGMSASWWSLTAQTAPTEIPLYSGSGDEQNGTLWGDYTSMSVDPVGGCAFWYVNQYLTANQTGSSVLWQTRISTFSAPGCGNVGLSPSSLSFGLQSTGTTSPTQTLILNNSQGNALTISSISFSGNNPNSFTQTNNCVPSVAAGGTCSIQVAFAPQVAGSLSAALNVNDNAGNSPQTTAVSGTATTSPTLTLSTTAINFGKQAFGTTSPNTSITVTNTGATTITFSSIAVTGANVSSFPESTNCPTNLNAGASCTIFVSFAPASAATFSAAVTLTSNAYGSPSGVALSGTGIPPVALNPGSVAYGNVILGNSKGATIKVTNQMTVPLTGISIASSGAPFSQTNNCGTSLAPNTQCSITITFLPTVAGTQSGTITMTDSAASSPQAVAVRGTGVLAVSLTPVSLAFGQVSVGTSSAAKISTLTNNEKVAITISNIAVTGAKASDYSQTNTCGTSLAAGAKCTISVVFTPSATGSRPASITVTDTGTNSPQVLPLVGTGK